MFAEHELVLRGLVPGLAVVREVPKHPAHDRRARHRRVVRVLVHVGRHAQLELQVVAVDRAVGLFVVPRTFRHVAPAVHHVDRRREAFPLQVARVGFGRTAENAVDVRRRVSLAGHAGRDQRGNVVADEIPVPVLVARPADGVALRSRPAENGPRQRARIGIVRDAVPGDFVALERVLNFGKRLFARRLVRVARPRHVEFLHARSRGAHFPVHPRERAFRPQPGLEAERGEAFRHVRQLHVVAAVAVVHENPAAGHVVFPVFLSDALKGIRRELDEFPVFDRRFPRLFVARHVGVGVAELEAPNREKIRATSEARVKIEDTREPVADEIKRVKAVFVVLERDFLRSREVVRSRRERVPQHAVAAVAQIKRRGIRAVVLVPAVRGNLDFRSLVGKMPVLLAAAVVKFVVAGRKRLRDGPVRERERLRFRENRRAVRAAQRERARRLVHRKDKRRRAPHDFLRRDFAVDAFPAHRQVVDENLRRGRVVQRIGESAVRRGLDAENVRREKFDAETHRSRRENVERRRAEIFRHDFRHREARGNGGGSAFLLRGGSGFRRRRGFRRSGSRFGL